MQNVRICIKYCTKAFGGRAPPGPAGGAYRTPPDPLGGLGKGGEGTGKEVGGREEKERQVERKRGGNEGKGGRYPLLSDFLATPMTLSMSIHCLLKYLAFFLADISQLPPVLHQL